MTWQGLNVWKRKAAILWCLPLLWMQTTQASICDFAAKHQDPVSAVDRKTGAIFVERLNQILDELKPLKELVTPSLKKDCYHQAEALLKDFVPQYDQALRDSWQYFDWKARYLLFFARDPSEQTALNAAKRAWIQSSELNTTAILPNVSLGKLYLEDQNRDDALKYFRRAIIVDPQDKSQRMAQIEALKELVSGLEPIPERAIEAGAKLEKMATLDQPLRILLAKLAARYNDQVKAERYLSKLNSETRLPIELDLLRTQGKTRALLDKIKVALKNLGSTHKVSEEQVNVWIREYADLAEQLRDWLEMRRSTELALARWPNEAKYLANHERSLQMGIILDAKNPMKDLERAEKLNPNSALVECLILEELFSKDVTQSATKLGAEVNISDEVIKSGEIHLNRLLSLEPNSFDGLFWRAYILSKKRVFGAADGIFTTLLERIEHGEKLRDKIPESRVWLEAARVKRARAFFVEAGALLKRGSQHVPADEKHILLEEQERFKDSK